MTDCFFFFRYAVVAQLLTAGTGKAQISSNHALGSCWRAACSMPCAGMLGWPYLALAGFLYGACCRANHSAMQFPGTTEWEPRGLF